MGWKPTPPPFRDFKKQIFSHAAAVADFIYQVGESPVLRQPSSPVPVSSITSPDMKEKIVYLKQCLVTYREKTGYGRGITAVQVGVSERISVIFNNGELLIIVNPKIIKTSERLYRYPEICMSANPIIAPTIRPAWIEFSYYDEQGQPQFWNTKDDTEYGKMMNRVFQHEFDHMEGIINIDRVASPKELILESDPSYYDHATFEEVR